MAINRFAILTDGFCKPGTYEGANWLEDTARALYVTWGYFNRTFSATTGKWLAFILEDDHIMNLYMENPQK